MIRTKWKRCLLILATCACLQGCIPLLVGGAVIAGAATAAVVIHDHRTWKTRTVDKSIENEIIHKLNAEPEFSKQTHIVVSVYRGSVLLAGQAPTQELKMQAQRIASTATGISKLYNEITVEAPSSTMTRISDDWITTKIKAQVMNNTSLSSAEIRVLTEDGTVFLMGTLTSKQQTTLVNIVRKVSGVQKVVKIFRTPPKLT